MKKEKEHLYELIISQLLFDKHINIADQLLWAVQLNDNVLPSSELTEMYARQMKSGSQGINKSQDACSCGHPGTSCKPARLYELKTTDSNVSVDRKHSKRRKKQAKGDTVEEKPPDLHGNGLEKKRKRGRPKKTEKTVTIKSKEEEETDNNVENSFEEWNSSDHNEAAEDTSDYVSELDSLIQSANGDIRFKSGKEKPSPSLTEATVRLNEGSSYEHSKVTSNRGKSKNSHLADKNSIMSKRNGIAGKLVKKAMREARKEPKSERRKRTAVFMCNYCLSKFSLNGLKEHLEEHCSVSGDELKCNLCDKVLMCGNRILSFNSHLRLHGSMQHFLCSVCGTGFKSEGAYKYHREKHKDKSHTCEVCNKSFKARGLLRSHMMTHSTVKSHICEYCAKGFRTATLLSKHVMIHTGEKPYRCDECGAEFRMSSHLRRHKDVHAGRKMYVCSVCNHAVYQRTNMRVHMKVHTGVRYSPIYVCNMCKLVFCVQEKLDEHTAGCRQTESAYEQQQRQGLQQKPAPLRVKRSRQSKVNSSNNDWETDFPASGAGSLINHQTKYSPLTNQPQALPEAKAGQLPESTSSGTRLIPCHQSTSIVQKINYVKPASNSGRLVSQQFTSGVQDLQQLQQQDILQQQSQFLQQLHAHQLYPQFYMQ